MCSCRRRIGGGRPRALVRLLLHHGCSSSSSNASEESTMSWRSASSSSSSLSHVRHARRWILWLSASILYLACSSAFVERGSSIERDSTHRRARLCTRWSPSIAEPLALLRGTAGYSNIPRIRTLYNVSFIFSLRPVFLRSFRSWRLAFALMCLIWLLILKLVIRSPSIFLVWAYSISSPPTSIGCGAVL